jgi:hypothetical protein
VYHFHRTAFLGRLSEFIDAVSMDAAPFRIRFGLYIVGRGSRPTQSDWRKYLSKSTIGNQGCERQRRSFLTWAIAFERQEVRNRASGMLKILSGQSDQVSWNSRIAKMKKG